MMLIRKRRWRCWMAGLFGSLAGLCAASEAAVAESASCQTVRLADIGWTDVTATTALASELLSRLGYTPRITVLSVPVTYYSMKNKDIDVFLGNWMPSMTADRQPFINDHSIDVIRPNLSGAKYTLATPDYAYKAGLTDFKDIQRFAAPLRNNIYGIEPGNDGNGLILRMLRQNQFGLGSFNLVESSEQGMLAEVERAYRARRPIVFLGWQPHLMNQRFKMRYLSGGDSVFGSNFGSAKVFTNVRAGYVKDCPNVGRLLNNLVFTIDGETQMMGDILDRKMSSSDAARSWLDSHPDIVRGWLIGVTTFRGGVPSVTAKVTPADLGGAFQQWIEGHKIPVGTWVANAMEGLKAHGGGFDLISSVIRSAVEGSTALLSRVPPPLAILIVAALAWAIKRSWPLAILVGLTFLFILNQGYWTATLETLSLVLFSTLVVMVIGVPVGVASAHHPRLADALKPLLDLMQTLPAFVYLIPALVLFGLGAVPGIVATVIFALPAPIRMTQLGVASTPKALREAAEAFGATPWQLLLKVELPSALPQIAAGLTQSIMLSLSMVVIAALVGAGGLGVPVVRALNTVQVGMGFEAGLAIVLLAIILDRVSRPRQGKTSS